MLAHRKQFTRQQKNSTARCCTDAGPIAVSVQHRRKDAPHSGRRSRVPQRSRSPERIRRVSCLYAAHWLKRLPAAEHTSYFSTPPIGSWN